MYMSYNSLKKASTVVLRIYAETGSVGLHELPEDILSSFVNISAARVFLEEFSEWDLSCQGYITSSQGNPRCGE